MPKDIKALKTAINQGKTLKEAMAGAGWPKSQLDRGRAGLGKRTLVELMKDGIKLGESISAAEQEQLIRGKLLENALMGSDKAVQSLKLLGQDRRVNMFTPESQTGIIVIGAGSAQPVESLPAEIVENKLLPE